MNLSVSSRLWALLFGTALSGLPLVAVSGQSVRPIQTMASPTSTPEMILIDLSGNGARTDHYWQYQVRPSSGAVELVKEERFKPGSITHAPHTFKEPAGAIQGCESEPSAASPDGRFIARCTGHSFHDEVISVTNANSLLEAFRWDRKDRSVTGFAWAPDSRSVAILNQSEHYGKDPIGLLAGLSGHPIPHGSVFLNVIDVESGKSREFLIRANVLYPLSRILKW